MRRLQTDHVVLIISIWVFAICLFLFSCKAPAKIMSQQDSKDSVRIEYKIKDTVIRIPGDTVRLQTKVPCPDADWHGEVKGNKTSVKASLKNGELNVDCHSDSLNLRIQYLEKELTNRNVSVTTNTIEVPVNVPKPYIPKWVWYLLFYSFGITLWKFWKQIVQLVKKLI